MARIKRIAKRIKNGGGNYFGTPKTDLSFIPSGSTLLDLALGGGWAEQRIINIVGDKSTGKSLLCIEAAANFARKYANGKIRYLESEAAFQKDYAAALGMPIDRVDFGNGLPVETVEDLFEDVSSYIDKSKGPELIILDSLDALSSRAELGRDIDQASYGGDKAKQMSQLFRRLTQRMAKADITLMIVSQTRDKIGAVWGRKTTRSGGRALDFYASQIIYLSQLNKIVKTVGKITRPVGVRIKAMTDKNKVGIPYRDAEFPILFGYGVADQQSCREWMKKVGSQVKKDNIDITELQKLVQDRWWQIERSFLPTERKYQ